MLQISTTKFKTTAVLQLEGQIVNGGSDNLRQVVRSLSGVNAVKLDLAQVSVIDASGLGLLLQLRQETEGKGRRFELANITTPIRRVLEMTRLDTVFRITSGVELFPAVAPRRQPIFSPALRSCA